MTTDTVTVIRPDFMGVRSARYATTLSKNKAFLAHLLVNVAAHMQHLADSNGSVSELYSDSEVALMRRTVFQ